MKCMEFKEWLVRREEALLREATAHIETCRGCRKMYELDSKLEEFISGGFFKEVEPPPGLAERVEFNLRHAEVGGTGARGFRRAGVLAAAAAAVFLFVFLLYPSKERFHSVEEIGRLAVENHLSHLAIRFTADEVRDVRAWFRDRLDFPVRPPDIEGLGLEFIGGRKCSLGASNVAYLFYSNTRTNGRSSIFVIDADDLGFYVEDGKTYRVTVLGRKVTFWKAGDVAYAMVE